MSPNLVQKGYTLAQKSRIFERIRAKSLSEKAIAKQFSLSRSTAYEWKSLTDNNKPPPESLGRKKLFGEASVKAWHGVLNMAQQNHRSIPVLKKPKLPDLPSVEEVAL